MIVALIGRIVGHPRRVRTQMRAAWRWCRQRPRRSMVILAVALWAVQIVFGNVAFAYADSNAIIAALGAKDSSGVPLEAYGLLPIDRGDVMTPQKGIYGVMTDFVWVGHMVSITIALNVLQLLLSFEWIDWLLAPIATWADLLKEQFEGLNWIPFALGVAAAVGSAAIIMGRRAAGVMDITISVLCGLAAVGMLANPLVNMQGTEGAFATVRSWGSDFAVAVIEDTGSDGSTGPVVELDEAGGAEAASVLSTTVVAEIVDIFVRQPAQSIAFGKTLDETCDAAFTEVMLSSPSSLSNNDVRTKVGDCDPAAKAHVESPSPWQVIAAYLSSCGSVALWGLILVLCVIFIWRVLSTIWAGIRSMGWVNVAVLPAIGRPQLGRALVDMALGLVSVTMMLVLLSGSLALTMSIARSLAERGLDVLLQLMMIGVFTFILTIGLVVAVFAMRKQGKSWGSMLGKLGLGKGTDAGAAFSPVQVLDTATRAFDTATRVADRFQDLRSKTKPKPKPDASTKTREKVAPVEQDAPSPTVAAPAGGRPGGDEPPSSLRGARGSDSPAPIDSASAEEPKTGEDIARRAAETGKVVYRLAKAAPGGWGAVGTEAGKVAVEKVVEKGVRGRGGKRGVGPEGTSPAPAQDGLPPVRVTTRPPERLQLGDSVESPSGNKIEVGANGRGHLVREGAAKPAAATVRPARPRSAAAEARIAAFRNQYGTRPSSPPAAPARTPAVPVRQLR